MAINCLRNRGRRIVALWGFCLMVLTLTWGCAASGLYLQTSQQVTDAFESGRLPAEYRYFIPDSGQRPYVLLGVLPEFAPPDGDRWRPVPDDTARQLRIVQGMQFFDEEAFGLETYGAKLMLPGGRQIGVWYSARGLGTAALGPDNRLSVWEPKRVKRLPLFRDD